MSGGTAAAIATAVLAGAVRLLAMPAVAALYYVARPQRW